MEKAKREGDRGERKQGRQEGTRRSERKQIRKMGESSPDLSLRLRRGSSDSRDSFYMDFAQVRYLPSGCIDSPR